MREKKEMSGIFIVGHGFIAADKISETIIDLVESSINNVAEGLILSAKMDFCKVAYIFECMRRTWARFDRNGVEALKMSFELCKIIRKKTGSIVSHDVWFWNQSACKYRLEAEAWERLGDE